MEYLAKIRIVIKAQERYALFAGGSLSEKNEVFISSPRPGGGYLYRITFHKTGHVNIRPMFKKQYIVVQPSEKLKKGNTVKLGSFSCQLGLIEWKDNPIPKRYSKYTILSLDLKSHSNIKILATDYWLIRDNISHAYEEIIKSEYSEQIRVLGYSISDSSPAILAIVWTLPVNIWSEINDMGVSDNVYSIASRKSNYPLLIIYEGQDDNILGSKSRVDAAIRANDGTWITDVSLDKGGAVNYTGLYCIQDPREHSRICRKTGEF